MPIAAIEREGDVDEPSPKRRQGGDRLLQRGVYLRINARDGAAVIDPDSQAAHAP